VPGNRCPASAPPECTGPSPSGTAKAVLLRSTCPARATTTSPVSPFREPGSETADTRPRRHAQAQGRRPDPGRVPRRGVGDQALRIPLRGPLRSARRRSPRSLPVGRVGHPIERRQRAWPADSGVLIPYTPGGTPSRSPRQATCADAGRSRDKQDGSPCPGRCRQGPATPCGPVTAQGTTTLNPHHRPYPPWRVRRVNTAEWRQGAACLANGEWAGGCLRIAGHAVRCGAGRRCRRPSAAGPTAAGRLRQRRAHVPLAGRADPLARLEAGPLLSSRSRWRRSYSASCALRRASSRTE
jgi:hypothetical protein